MTGSTTGDAQSSPPRAASSGFRLSRGQIAIASAAVVVLIAAIVLIVHYRSGSQRRRYDTELLSTLDKLLTAQEGFFYDSAHYVGSLRRLPTVKLAPGVRVELYNPDRRSWWGVATHGALNAHRCVVWVGTAPPSFPVDVRAPENEAKPICFDDAETGSTQIKKS